MAGCRGGSRTAHATLSPALPPQGGGGKAISGEAMQVYKASRLTLILGFFITGFLTLVSLPLFIAILPAANGQLIAKAVLLGWLGILIRAWYVQLWKMPVEIRWVDGEPIEFLCIMNNVKIPVEDITSIKAARHPGKRFVTLRHLGGKISLVFIQDTPGFDEFLDKVSAANPRAEIWVPKFYWNPK